MSHNQAPQAQLTTIAEFPRQYFLENLAVREDNSVLVTAMNHKELWYVPTSSGEKVEPLLLHTFDTPTLGLAEIEPDVFLMLAGNVYTTHESFIHKIDLRNWKPGDPVSPELFCRFPSEARGLNGCCLLKSDVLLVADCFAGLIWRVDFAPGGNAGPSIRVWARHDSMGYYPGKMKPEQPGVNGIRYAAKSHHLYYTATAKKLFMRWAVDPDTLDPQGEPELVVAGRMGDDFCLDEDANVIYLTTHRQNTIDVVSMDPGLNSGFTQSVAGEPFTDQLIGPSSGAWGRAPGQQGRTGFFITDGGTASPPPAGPQPAKLLRVDFQKIPDPFPGST